MKQESAIIRNKITLKNLCGATSIKEMHQVPCALCSNRQDETIRDKECHNEWKIRVQTHLNITVKQDK